VQFSAVYRLSARHRHAVARRKRNAKLRTPSPAVNRPTQEQRKTPRPIARRQSPDAMQNARAIDRR